MRIMNSKKSQMAELVLLSSICVLGACGKATKSGMGSGNGDVARVANALDLQGSYQASGNVELGVREGGLGCVVNDVSVVAYNMTVTQTYYEDTQCKGSAAGKIVTVGEYKVGKEIPSKPGVRELDWKISKVLLTPLVDNWTTIFGMEASGDCKLQQIPLNHEVDVTGLSCGSFGDFIKKDQVYYMSFLVSEKELDLTKLPSKSTVGHLGSLNTPAPRNQDLKVKYYRK